MMKMTKNCLLRLITNTAKAWFAWLQEVYKRQVKEQEDALNAEIERQLREIAEQERIAESERAAESERIAESERAAEESRKAAESESSQEMCIRGRF